MVPVLPHSWCRSSTDTSARTYTPSQELISSRRCRSNKRNSMLSMEVEFNINETGQTGGQITRQYAAHKKGEAGVEILELLSVRASRLSLSSTTSYPDLIRPIGLDSSGEWSTWPFSNVIGWQWARDLYPSWESQSLFPSERTDDPNDLLWKCS